MTFDNDYIVLSFYLNLVHPKWRVRPFAHPSGVVWYSQAGTRQVNAKSALRTASLRVAVTVAGFTERHWFPFDLFGKRVVLSCKNPTISHTLSCFQQVISVRINYYCYGWEPKPWCKQPKRHFSRHHQEKILALNWRRI